MGISIDARGEVGKKRRNLDFHTNSELGQKIKEGEYFQPKEPTDASRTKWQRMAGEMKWACKPNRRMLNQTKNLRMAGETSRACKPIPSTQRKTRRREPTRGRVTKVEEARADERDLYYECQTSNTIPTNGRRNEMSMQTDTVDTSRTKPWMLNEWQARLVEHANRNIDTSRLLRRREPTKGNCIGFDGYTTQNFEKWRQTTQSMRRREPTKVVCFMNDKQRKQNNDKTKQSSWGGESRRRGIDS